MNYKNYIIPSIVTEIDLLWIKKKRGDSFNATKKKSETSYSLSCIIVAALIRLELVRFWNRH